MTVFIRICAISSALFTESADNPDSYGCIYYDYNTAQLEPLPIHINSCKIY